MSRGELCSTGGLRPVSDLQSEAVYAPEGGDELVGPGPAGGEAKPGAAAAASDDGTGVQQAVAESFGLGAGEVAVEGDESRPGQQVVGDEGRDEPGGVESEVGRGEVGEPGVFGVADQLLGSAPAALQCFEVGDVGAGEVGDEDLEAVAVDVGEGELGAGVGFFAAGDHAGAVRPAREINQSGEFGDLAEVTFVAAVVGDRRLPSPITNGDKDVGDLDGEVMADHEPRPARAAAVQEPVRHA